jgi:hypothetical protein
MDALSEDLAMNMGANSRYGIRLAAPETEVVPVLSSLPGVLKVEYVGSFEKGTVDIILEAEKKVDIRRILFDECAKRNWYILMITPLGISLEDIFIQLVSKQEEIKAISGKQDEAPVQQNDIKTDDIQKDTEEASAEDEKEEDIKNENEDGGKA